jgi:hypothetical protein
MVTIRLTVAIAAALALFACRRSDIGVGQGQRVDMSACPEDDVLETLHDAVFFLEHRRDEARVTQDLERIRRWVTSGSPGAAMVLSFTQRIAALAARHGAVEPESEQIRAELHASPCMRAEAHARFHRALPPVH